MLKKQHQHAKILLPVPAYLMLRVEKAIQHLSINIQLHLHRSRVTHAHRRRVSVAAEPTDFPLLQLAFTLDAVHDLNLVWASRQCAKQPILPRCGFVIVSAVYESKKRERRIAQPTRSEEHTS